MDNEVMKKIKLAALLMTLLLCMACGGKQTKGKIPFTAWVIQEELRSGGSTNTVASLFCPLVEP